MQNLLNYYGSKWRLASAYGHPRRRIVCEPFAGGAGYSLYWNVEKAILIEKNPIIFGIWHYLINHATESEIMSLDPNASTIAELEATSPAKPLVDLARCWFERGISAVGRKKMSEANKQCRDTGDGLFWSEKVQRRVCESLPKLRNWEAYNCDWSDAEGIVGDRDVHFFVDPPYQKQGGSKYMAGCNNNSLDFQALGDWCRKVTQPITVTEGGDADWLDFKLLKMAQSQKNGGGEYAEVVWSRNCDFESQLLTEDES